MANFTIDPGIVGHVMIGMLSTEMEGQVFDAAVDADAVEAEVASSRLDVGKHEEVPDGVRQVERVGQVRVFKLILDPIEGVLVRDADVTHEVAGGPDRTAKHLKPLKISSYIQISR